MGIRISTRDNIRVIFMKIHYYPLVNTPCFFTDMIVLSYLTFDYFHPDVLEQYYLGNYYTYETEGNIWCDAASYQQSLEYPV